MKKPFYLFLIIFLGLGCQNNGDEMNPFLTEYDTPYQIPPCEKIEFSHYEPAFEEGMKQHLLEVEAIATNNEKPTFENTIVELERSGETLDKVSAVFFNLLGSNTSDEMDALAMRISPTLSSHRDSILLNKELFSRIKSVYEQKDSLELTTEQERLLDQTHKSFVRNGANLTDSEMNRLVQINSSLSTLSVQFDQNVLKETNGFSLIIENEDELDGLPAEEIRQAALLAESEGHEGKWVFKPTRVSMYPFLTYSTQRELREQLYNSYIQRGDNDNEFDNKSLIVEMLKLRKEKAKLMGFESHADYVLDDTMAKQTSRVDDLLEQIWEPGIARA